MNLYDITVPVFIKMLGNLSGVLTKAEAYTKEKGLEESDYLNNKLAPDMFPLARQIQSASDNAKGTSARLAGVEIPKFDDNEKTFAELQARIAKTIDFLKTIKAADVNKDAATKKIEFQYRPGNFLTALDYAREYGLPNFFFHTVTAYDICRHSGVTIGKMDYIGALSFSEK